MKQEFLKSLNLSDDVIAQIQAENGKDVQAEKDKAKKVQDDLTALNAKIGEYEDKIKAFEKQDAAGLAAKIEELQKVIDDRKAADAKAIHDKNMSDRLDKVTGEKKYLNEYTRIGIHVSCRGQGQRRKKRRGFICTNHQRPRRHF